jgi:hypothetical protein
VSVDGTAMPWDPFCLAVFRSLGRFARRLPTVSRQMNLAERKGFEGVLTPFGLRHPVLGGVLAAILWGTVMMLLFDLLSWFRAPLMMAILFGAGGCVGGIATGWSWSYTARTGHKPEV